MDKITAALKERYKHIHPLLFSRCVEKSITNVELFDLLEGMPKKFPIVWDGENSNWSISTDILQTPDLKKPKRI